VIGGDEERGTAAAPRRRAREAAARMLLALGVTVATLGALEIGLRPFVRPSRQSTGRLFGTELPPVRLVPPEPPRRVPRDASPGRIRQDDLTGLIREDREIGYAPRENARSTNGWWQSNNLGARSRRDTSSAIAPGTTRVLVFGDSFAAGSRVPQESAWPAVIEASHPDLEVVSLGVDGYSAAQSWLRYRVLGERVAHDVVVLTLSPRADFWRDVNTLRALDGWRSYTVMPRFVVEDGALRLVPGPYDPPTAIYADNREAPSARLLDHLRTYDRFYVSWMYERLPAPLADSVLGRFALARLHDVLTTRRHAQTLEPGSEAVTVSGSIARAMRDAAAARGARFLLVLLPSERDVKRLRRSDAERNAWQRIVAGLSEYGVPCLDLAPDLIAAPADRIDRGFDGTHHGPRTNALVADAVARALLR
jgi:lysophospholipase L1-like esterase